MNKIPKHLQEKVLENYIKEDEYELELRQNERHVSQNKFNYKNRLTTF